VEAESRFYSLWVLFIYLFIFTFSIGTENDYLPNQGTSTAKECKPCEAQGHTGFSNQKHAS
jgi:hypothetical protein